MEVVDEAETDGFLSMVRANKMKHIQDEVVVLNQTVRLGWWF